MLRLNGIGASSGVAVADIFFLQKLDLTVEEKDNCDVLFETQKYENAKKQAILELGELYEHALKTDFDTAMVFEMHQMLLEDYDFVSAIEDVIKEGKNAEFAVKTCGDTFRDMFLAMDDAYMKGRSADIVDISSRLIRIMKGIKETAITKSTKIIVCAEDLLPSETVKLDKKLVAGFVTRQGSKTSHSAILARTMGIPSVVALGDFFDEIPQTGKIALDGDRGTVIVDPTQTILANYSNMLELQEKEKAELEQFKGKKAVTKSGHVCKIGANIGSIDDISAVIENDADCVGLFRSEFIYLDSDHFPTEEEQFVIYKEILEKLAPRNVIIRTLDLGADKQAPYFGIPGEENPALGYRAIRICLAKPEIFEAQLRALLKASAYGNLSIMFPMISHMFQIHEAKNLFESIKKDLDKEGIPYSKDIELGVMIETPASVMISSKLAKEVDFFSIGTNDLTQYALAVDRMNTNVEHLFDSRNEAVLAMIEMTAKSAKENGIWVGICGESAGDFELTDFYMQIGIDELSVSPSKVLKLKKTILEGKN